MKKQIFFAWALLMANLSLPAQETETLYLSGVDSESTVTWDFYCSKGMNSERWRKIEVPSCWELQGFGEYTYGRYYKKKDGKVSDETGKYRYDFRVPADWKDKFVEIVFEGVMTDATVYLNGQQAGETHRGGFTAFGYDITRLIKPGKKNTLEVQVAKQSSDKSVNAAERRADWWLFGGIYRPVYLRALPVHHIERAVVDARADGSLALRLYTGGLADGYSLQTTVEGLGTQTSSLTNAVEQTIKTQWNSVRQWNTEHPHLYNMMLSLVDADGKEVHRINQKIGFRTMEFRPRDGFYLNGTKLRIKGVNRHCCYPETGRATSRRLDLQDLKIIKGMNANAIRSHYPPDTHLLELCDSLGVLYFDELPGWQNHYSDETGARILREMILHDANHPCIFAWGNGNEGGFNLSLDSLFRALDPQRRQVVHPWALYDGVDAHHYPAYQTGVARLGNGYQVFMPTEFLHSQYDKGGGASLADYWTAWSRNPLFAGGFIWAYADEAIVRTDRDGALDSDGGNAPDGVVGPHREKEGSWYTIRDVWSPLQIAPLTVRPGWDGCFTVTNGYLFSDLAEVRMEYHVLACPSPLLSDNKETRTLATGRVDLPKAFPGESVRGRIALSDEAKGGDVLQIVARDAVGDTLNVWTWPMKYADEYFAANHVDGIHPHQTTATVENGNTLAAPNGVRAQFDKTTGMLASVHFNEQEIPFNNGPVPVGMKMNLKQMIARQDGADALLVMKYTGAVDSIVWRMTADGLLGMDAVLLNNRKGNGYEGEFFDKEIRNFGFSFSYPESCCSGMRWLGRGSYRVWRNRQQGTNYAIWQKDYNNTVTGDCEKPIVYPEFKGYHANLYWAQMQSATAPFTVLSETDGLYYRVFTPEEPTYLNNGLPTMQPFPEGDLSFLLEIPGIQSYKPIEQLGPQAQPSHVRINIGDEGLRIKLWFDFAPRENLSALFVGTLSAQAGDSAVRVARYRGDKACAVSYTFDDGYAEHYTMAAPELEKRGFRGTFYINGSNINQDNEQVCDTTRATWSQLREMSERGHEIANHGWAHRNFARFPLDELKEDILRNDSAIQVNIGKRPKTFAYPNNNKSEPGKSFAEKGRVGTRLEQWSVGSKRTLQDLNKWLDSLIKKGEWGVGMTHGLTYGYDAFRDPQRLWKHWDYVKQYENEVWVATFEEVAAYVKERDAIRLMVERSGRSIEVTPKIELDSELFTQPLTMVVTQIGRGRVTAKQGEKKLAVEMRAGQALFDFNPYGGKIKIRIE